ncbi:uncharacterized protein LOC130821546 [Amaranthus tricolor]|uniref:uncharacterized protein LOC130821546 n=1 Tax=Amaranthus tricolor TaxID=29722 RepID=UPI002589A42E|nr:uncharacterized protein LOC130821546 [Amaranthus tricolor]
MDKGKRPTEEGINTQEEPWRALVNAPAWAEIEALGIWDRKEGESDLDYTQRVEMFYKRSKQVYEGIMDEKMAELKERSEQFHRDLNRRVRAMETVGRDRFDVPESSGARANVVEEVVPVVDPNSVLLINFDELDFEEDPEEDPEEDLEEDPGEDPEEESEEDFGESFDEEQGENMKEDSLGVVEEPYEDNVGDGYNVDVERGIADRHDVMSDSDTEIVILGDWPVRREDPMSEEESEIIMWEERPPEPVIVELSDSVGRLAMSDSLSVGTPSDSDSTSSDDSSNADFEPDRYMEDQDRLDASLLFP